MNNYLIIKNMKKIILLLTLVFLLIGCSYRIVKDEESNSNITPQNVNVVNDNSDIEDDKALNLQKEREDAKWMLYRSECINEINEKFQTIDNVVKSSPGITTEQVQLIGRRAGITDENNYVINKDILVNKCISNKKSIYDQ